MRDGHVLIGRDEELRTLAAALEDARAGRGRVIVLSGEPGIGKTRLCDELATIARKHGVETAWGRCWEAGGAPPFWPWIEIVRALFDRGAVAAGEGSDLDAALADVGRMVPVIRSKLGEVALPAIEPREARFRLFESITTIVTRAAMPALVVVIDDAHVADEASLRLLQFIARTIRSRPVLLLVTMRDVATKPSPETAAVLHEIAREGEKLALGRLAAPDVEEWLAHHGVATDAAQAVFRVTEGNPFFVDEMVRCMRARPAGAATVPDEVRAAIAAHLRLVSEEARGVLVTASALGRDVDSRLLGLFSGVSREAIERAVSEARAVRILEDTADDGRLRFSHILIREELHRELSSTARAKLHWTIGTHLSAGSEDDAARAVHHLVLGVDAGSLAEVVEAARRAAHRATRVLAFEEAISTLQAARALARPGSREACELAVDVGEARIRSGALSAGQRDCLEAVGLARTLGEPLLLARAALVYGTELIGGRVDPQMVSLLREALAQLPATEVGVRVRVQARLASALVPSTNEMHIQAERLANESIEVARALGDGPTLYYVLQWAVSALGFSVDASVRKACVAEMLEHAVALGDSFGIIRARIMNILLAIEDGDPSRDRLVEDFIAHIESLKRPFYGWRVPLLTSALATLDGRFEDAARDAREALRISETHGVPSAVRLYALLRTSAMHALGDPDAYPEERDAYVAAATGVPFGHYFLAWFLALRGRLEEARNALVGAPPLVHALPLLAPVGETACLVEDRELAATVYALLAPEEPRNPQPWGPSGAMCISPTSVVLGRLAHLLDRRDEAIAHFERGIERCKRSRMRPHLAWTRYRLAAVLVGRGSSGDRERARSLLDEARVPAEQMTMTRLCREIAALDVTLRGSGSSVVPEPASTSAGSPPDIRLEREGDVWTLSGPTRPIRLRDSKGVFYLERLLRHPHQEIHVGQLLGLDTTEESALRSDAGPMLDERAKARYKERLEDLRDTLEEARSFGDRARAEKAEAEMDAIAEELARGVGLGGRDRKAAAGVERARINVQRRLRDVLERIGEHAPAFGRWLEASIKTGSYCSYAPVSAPPKD